MIHTIVKWLSQVCEVISIFITTLLIVKSISSGMISTISFTQSDSPSAITVLITYSLNRIQFFIFIQRQHNNEVRTEMASLRFDFTHSLDFFNLLLLIPDCIVFVSMLYWVHVFWSLMDWSNLVKEMVIRCLWHFLHSHHHS